MLPHRKQWHQMSNASYSIKLFSQKLYCHHTLSLALWDYCQICIQTAEPLPQLLQNNRHLHPQIGQKISPRIVNFFYVLYKQYAGLVKTRSHMGPLLQESLENVGLLFFQRLLASIIQEGNRGWVVALMLSELICSLP